MVANKESKQSYITLITSWTSLYTPLVYQCFLSIILTSPPVWLMAPVSSCCNLVWLLHNGSMVCKYQFEKHDVSRDKGDLWVSSQTPSKQGKHFYERSYHSLNFLRIWLARKTNFFDRCPWFKFNNLGAGTSYGLEILHQYDKRVRTKSQKVLRDNSHVCRSYRGKTRSEGSFLPPPLPLPS